MTIICATFTLGTHSGSNSTDFVTQLLYMYILPHIYVDLIVSATNVFVVFLSTINKHFLLLLFTLVISQNMKKKHTSTLAMTEFVKKYIQIEMTQKC